METLQDLVTEGARRFGPRPALLMRPSFRTRTVRYRDLGATVPRAAAVLAEAGVEPGRAGHRLGGQPARVGPRLPGACPRGRRRRPPRRAPHRRRSVARSHGRPTRGSSSPRARRMRRRASSACPILWIESLPDLARDVAPVPPAADRRRHPGRDRVHQRHDRRAEGRHAHARQPAGARHRHAPGASPSGRDDRLLSRPAALAPLRAGPRPHRAAAGRRQRRLPGQPTAGRPAAHLPRLPACRSS